MDSLIGFWESVQTSNSNAPSDCPLVCHQGHHKKTCPPFPRIAVHDRLTFFFRHLSLFAYSLPLTDRFSCFHACGLSKESWSNQGTTTRLKAWFCDAQSCAPPTNVLPCHDWKKISWWESLSVTPNPCLVYNNDSLVCCLHFPVTNMIEVGGCCHLIALLGLFLYNANAGQFYEIINAHCHDGALATQL